LSSERPSRTAALAERLSAARDRAEELPGGSLVREIVDSERELGGGLIAGGVAFRLFLWLVPFGLVVAALLSFWSVHDEESLEEASKNLGIGAAAAEAASSALQGGDRNAGIALAFGVFFLGWFTIGAVRALNLAFALAWQLKPPRIRRPLTAIVFFNGLFAILTLTGTAVAWLREEIGLTAIASLAGTLALTTGVVLAAMWELPHRATRARELLPGAVLVAVGIQLVEIAVIFYFAPRLGRSEETYGALGVAATLLLWLYVVSRLLTGGAFLNAALWQHRTEAEAA
jgi:uncharacterized BrkB/YihY/UPF0761 family membrane protein